MKTYKLKVLQLHEYTLKQFLNPTPPQKKNLLVPPKVKNYPKIKLKSKVRIVENLEN